MIPSFDASQPLSEGPRILCQEAGWPTVFELDEGQSIDMPGQGGRLRTVRLVGVRQFTEPDWWVPDNETRAIVVRAEVAVEIDGEPGTLLCRPYESPREIGGLRLYVESTRDWARTPQYLPLADMARSVRFSCVAAGEPWGPPLRFPIDGFRWRCSTYQNTWNALVPYNRLYYHRGEDFGAIPDRLDVVAPAAGRIVKSPRPDGDGRSNTLSIQLEGANARLALAHMNVESIPAGMGVGKRVAVGDKLGQTGCTWSGRRSQHADPHLHCGLRVAEVDVSLYPLIVESYFRTYPDAVLAIAGSFGFTTADGDYVCDGSRSVARPGRRIVRWRWLLHDGRRVDGPVARATYDRPGAYVEELTVTADDGTEDVDFLHVRAYAPGKIRGIARGWLHTSPCRGIAPGMPVTVWSRISEVRSAAVDFGDGRAPEPMESEMIHVYDKPGRYTIAVRGTGPDDEPVAMSVRVWVERN